jgi:CRISPR-associated exonuclease Cas4
VNDDDDLTVPISAIEHYSYCPRQCALIHIEQVFEDNIHTIRGTIAHERVDAGVGSVQTGVRFVRGLPLWSERHGLRGRADLVEFRPDGYYPVEYKSGPRKGRHADLQLCAQAMCLEEMFGVPVPLGAVFHRASATRREVCLDPDLRAATLEIVEAIRAMLAETKVPPPANDARCKRCSLQDACVPGLASSPGRLASYENDLFTPLTHGT